jgi:outer membrane protein insertion porin family
MTPTITQRITMWSTFFGALFWVYAYLGAEQDLTPQELNGQTTMPQAVEPRRINNIIIVGNQTTSKDAILNYIPYKIGEYFSPQRSGQLIRNLYSGLKRFRNITLKGVPVGNDLIDLYVIVEEKKPLKDIIFKGNKHLTESEIRKKINLDIPAIDAEELKIIGEQIKKLYYEKGFQNVVITTELTVDEDGKAVAQFTFDEGKKSRIRRIMFEGNKFASDKDLRDALFTKEEWILSFLDKTGSFHPERLEADKHMIEQYYQNNGFIQGKVIDVKIDQESDTNILNITFVVEEGDRYTISKVSAPGNDIVSEEFLLANIPIKPGQYYSREAIGNTIKMMEFLWGNMGYIYASIEPSVQPDEDTKTVALSFNSDIGKKVFLNRIKIKGNKKTRDKVIRRRINLQEGGIVTQGQMESSRNSVANLGYFDQKDGVNWKLRRINDELADLDLIVKEAKTGHANIQFGFGGAGTEINSVISGFNVKGSIADTNLFGTGLAVNLEGGWSKDEQNLTFHLAQPWLFDKPVSGAMDIYHKRPSYDQLKHVASAINSKLTGAALTAGFITPGQWRFFNAAQILFSLGADSLKYNNEPRVLIGRADLPPCTTVEQAANQYRQILAKEFTPGEYVWLANNIEQDKRNHPMFPSRGHKWKLSSKLAIPSFGFNNSSVVGVNECSKIGFGKLYFDYIWYNPLIGEYDLIFKLHLFFGLAIPFSKRSIPFGELFHIGGDATVRGFSYGEIGPQFLGDTIGGKKAFFLNAELIFPITQDMSLRGVAFYDGGAGWDNPYVNGNNAVFVTSNSFDYRHAVGFGIRMLRPMPIRVDWGFKLDPRTGERESQVHFGMTYDW